MLTHLLPKHSVDYRQNALSLATPLAGPRQLHRQLSELHLPHQQLQAINSCEFTKLVVHLKVLTQVMESRTGSDHPPISKLTVQ